MPELPEVETIRRDLMVLIGHSFIAVTSAVDSVRVELQAVLGGEVTDVARRGKYLFIQFANYELVIHLGMSGRLFVAGTEVMHKHKRWHLVDDDGRYLVFVDRRRFGRFEVVAAGSQSSFRGLLSLGPEPLSAAFNAELLLDAAQATRRTIKQLLLDQEVVAGLGNIYVDECLHASQIHPARVGLNKSEASVLVASIKKILRRSIIDRGSSFSLHRDGLVRPGEYTKRLSVFDREGMACPRCRTAIRKIIHRGRSTYLCARCQRAPR